MLVPYSRKNFYNENMKVYTFLSLVTFFPQFWFSLPFWHLILHEGPKILFLSFKNPREGILGWCRGDSCLLKASFNRFGLELDFKVGQYLDMFWDVIAYKPVMLRDVGRVQDPKLESWTWDGSLEDPRVTDEGHCMNR